MSFIDKNVNIILLFIIAGLIAALAGMTSYYQQSYMNLSTTYTSEVEKFTQVRESLEKIRGELNQTSVQVQIKEEREQDLSSKYSELKTENAQLTTDLESTSKNLKTTQSDLTFAQSELVTAELNVITLNTTVQKLNYDLTYVDGTSKSVYDELQIAIDLLHDYSDPDSSRYVNEQCDPYFDKVLARVSQASIDVRSIRQRLDTN